MKWKKVKKVNYGFTFNLVNPISEKFSTLNYKCGKSEGDKMEITDFGGGISPISKGMKINILEKIHISVDVMECPKSRKARCWFVHKFKKGKWLSSFNVTSITTFACACMWVCNHPSSFVNPFLACCFYLFVCHPPCHMWNFSESTHF